MIQTKLSAVRKLTPTEIVGRQKEKIQEVRLPLCVILNNIRSLHNVGSLFRTADAFGVSKLYLCGYTGTPPRKEITKVALGAEETVPWEKRGQTWKLVEELQKKGIMVVALENLRRTVLRKSTGSHSRDSRMVLDAESFSSDAAAEG